MSSLRPDGSVEINGCLLLPGQVPRWQRAVDHARAGELDAAIDELQTVVGAQPGFVPALIQVAHFMLSADRYRDAREAALAAAKPAVLRGDLALELIRLLRRFEEHEAVSSLVERTDWTTVRSPDLLLAVAGELGPIGLYQQAERLLTIVETLAPQHPTLAVLRGTIQMMSGDVAAARQSLRSGLARSRVELPHVRWLLSLQAEERETAQQVDEVEKALDRVSAGTEDEAYLRHALHNLYHAAGRYDEAWRALEQGARIKRRLVHYNPDEQRALFERLTALELLQSSGMRQRPGAGPRAIFIVGMHRSGTSILERVLSGHSDVADGGESYVFPAAMRYATDHFSRGVIDTVMLDRAARVDMAVAGERFQEYARWKAGGKRWFTEKLPSNFLHLGFILQALPDAIVLHMRRDPVDVCFSNLRTFFSQAALYSYDQSELAEYFLHYEALMRHWHRRFPGRILDVDYAAFVAEPEIQAKAVMEFCGLDFEAEALQVDKRRGFTATASIGSVRKGILKDRGRVWENYRAHLGPLLRGLGRA